MNEGYCALHKIKCGEIKDNRTDIKEIKKDKVSLWAFRILITVMILLFGALYSIMETKAIDTLRILNVHVERSNVILHNVTHGLNEVALNQRKVMANAGLEFEHLPDYDTK